MSDTDEPLVLVVDDEAHIRELFGLALREDGFRVIAAADGREALAILDREIPQVVLLDMAMPNASGLSVLQAIRERPETATIPVLVVSGVDPQDDLWGGRDWGWDMYLTKPIDMADLSEAIRKLINGS